MAEGAPAAPRVSATGRTQVTLVPAPAAGAPTRTGGVRSRQEAHLIAPDDVVEALWSEPGLERLGLSYWRHLERISGRLLRVRHDPEGHTVAPVGGRPALLRFRRPAYSIGDHSAAVAWPIERGALVAREGAGRGHLRIELRRDGREPDGRERVLVAADVANYFPLLRGRGALSVAGARLYRFTQLRLHVAITHRFLRSLELLDSDVAGDANEARPPPSRL